MQLEEFVKEARTQILAGARGAQQAALGGAEKLSKGVTPFFFILTVNNRMRPTNNPAEALLIRQGRSNDHE